VNTICIQLSNVINGKRGLGPALAEKVAHRLSLPSHQKELFLESLKAKFSKSKIQRVVSQSKLHSLQNDGRSKSLELDLFKTISNWYHFTLLELIKITPIKNHSVSFFAKRLGIPSSEINLAFERLNRLELITKNKRGWEVNQDVVIADKGIPAESIRNFHRQVLEKAILALSFQNSEERYGSSSTIPIKIKDLPKAIKMIQNFRLELDRTLSDPKEGDEVFALSLQFFKLTNPGDNL
jgi:uncharacterized protein (TIGR02147 family)